jgi:hypothetical protein
VSTKLKEELGDVRFVEQIRLVRNYIHHPNIEGHEDVAHPESEQFFVLLRRRVDRVVPEGRSVGAIPVHEPDPRPISGAREREKGTVEVAELPAHAFKAVLPACKPKVVEIRRDEACGRKENGDGERHKRARVHASPPLAAEILSAAIV